MMSKATIIDGLILIGFMATQVGLLTFVAIWCERGFKLMLNNKIFDWLKWISIVALPALSTFIVVLGKIWGWGDIAPMVAQTITAIAVLLGALLGISTIQYNKDGESE